MKRVDTLDAFRGLAILLMILSGSIPFGVLPEWMYHAQVPPPKHVFNPNIPGITWVDLVFPFFLFAMGAAFPLSLSKKLEQNIPIWKIFTQIIIRGFSLAFFAIFLQHTKPFLLSKEPNSVHYLIAILSFGLLFFIYTRFDNLSKKTSLIIKALAILSAIILLSFLSYPDGSKFSINRSDIIIIVLANTAMFGSIIWILTKDNLLLRVGILAFLFALRLTQSIEGSWNILLWNYSPIPWLYKLYYLQYLFIVIPGTIAGDLILKWIKNDEKIVSSDNYNFVVYGLLMFLIVFLTVIGLFSRQIILALLVSIVIYVLSTTILKNKKDIYSILLKTFSNYGFYFLLLGFFFEAYEGGIKKDKSTLSYYFVTSGLAFFTYNFFSVIIDKFKKVTKVKLLIESGQNPMIAYIGASHVIIPLLALTSLNIVLQKIFFSPWLGFIKGIIITLLVALLSSFFTKKKYFWRT